MLTPTRLAVCSALSLVSAAHATWSIILLDARTGELAIASATCLTNFDLQANASVVVVGRGAAAAQSFVDSTGQNRALIRDRLIAGASPQAILNELAVFDGGHQTRQYGILDTQARAVTFTGSEAGAWAGGITGSFDYTHAGLAGRIIYAIQGNVLTGEPVVAAALSAARTTPGDIPVRLMAAMEAARQMGGDGRCSCTTGGPQACGAPPATFTKSADIGYMIVSRLGDSDIGGLSLPAGGAGIAAAGDVTGDGRPDLVVPDASTGSASRFLVYPNSTLPGVVSPSFGAAVVYPCVLNAAAAAIGDFSGDGIPDVAVGGGSTATGAAGAVTLYRGRADGLLDSRLDVPSPRRIVGVALADLDGINGLDLVYLTASGLYIRLNDGAGNFGAQSQLGSPGSGFALTIADIAGDERPDIIIGGGFAGLRYFTNLGGGAFSAQQTYPLSSTARGCVPGDFDGDGDTDFAVVISSSLTPCQILLRTPTGLAPGQVLLPGGGGVNIAGGDINGDGRADLTLMYQFVQSRHALGNGDGTFTLTPRGTDYPTAGAIALADLNGDGYAERLYSAGTTLTVSCNSRGTLINQPGFAPGNYFLSLNIANQARADADPVLQLRAAFDTLRAGLVNTPDAVTSLVTAPPAGPLGKRQALTIELRDWRGLPASAPLRSATVTRDGPGPHATTGGTLIPAGPGRYTLLLTPLRHGEDRLRIVVDAGQRPVTLMPMPVVRVRPPTIPKRDD